MSHVRLVVGERAGVSLRTAYRRLEDAPFRQQLAEARGDLIKRATGRLAAACSAAAATKGARAWGA